MATGLAAGAIAVGLLGTFAQAESARQSAEFNAKMSERDAEFAEIQAQDARLRGLDDERRLAEEEERLIADQRAVMAAQGIDVESGTAVQLQESVSRSVARDIQARRTNAIREAYGLRATSGDLRARSAMQRAGGEATANATILGGVSNTAFFAGSQFGGGGSSSSAAGGQSAPAGTGGGARMSGFS